MDAWVLKTFDYGTLAHKFHCGSLTLNLDTLNDF